MIRQVLAESWAQGPLRFLGAVLLAPVALVAGWALLVLSIVALGGPS